MNDYSMGAMEALSWSYAILRKCRTVEDFQAAQREMGEMLMRLSTGAAVSFKTRVEFIPEP